MPTQQVSDPSVNALYDLITSQRITVVIYVAAKLGVADVLAEGPKTPAEVARCTEAHEQSIRRLLRALVSIGVCKQSGADRFELTTMGAHLASNAEQSVKAFALMEGERLAPLWRGLIESVRTGKTGAELAGFNNSFEMMARNPETVATFNEAMVAITRAVAPAVIAAYDFSGIRKLYDVGGGHGELLGAILKAHPSMRGAIVDLPRCAEGAKKHLAEAGVSDRGEFIAGNFFESVPSGADAIIMKSIIHDWNDELSIKILGNCRKALPQGAKLLLVERTMPEVIEANPDHCAITMGDLNMMRGPGGAERTEKEYRDLLAKGGFRITRVLPAGRMNVIESAAE